MPATFISSGRLFEHKDTVTVLCTSLQLLLFSQEISSYCCCRGHTSSTLRWYRIRRRPSRAVPSWHHLRNFYLRCLRSIPIFHETVKVQGNLIRIWHVLTVNANSYSKILCVFCISLYINQCKLSKRGLPFRIVTSDCLFLNSQSTAVFEQSDFIDDRRLARLCYLKTLGNLSSLPILM